MATLKLHSAAFDEQLARKLDETTDWLMHNMIDKHDGTSAPDTSKRTTSPDDGSLPEGIPNESTPANKLSTVSFAIRELDGTISVRPNHRASGLIESRFRPGVVLAQRYCLEREIGRGGMGIVYLAMDSLLERTVAVKVVLPLLGGLAREGQSANETIADEAKIGAKLAHPNIAQVYDFGVFAECPFAVFEYIPGKSLREIILERGKLSLDDTRRIIAPLAEALDFAHAQGVVHRDLKPDNIRVTDGGTYKVLDLGLAKRFLTNRDWQFAGTPAYASPEQALERPSDGRADQYALGIIAYELLTGRRPFEAPTVQLMLEMHVHLDPIAPIGVLPTAASAILRALRKTPSLRYDRCTDFALALGCQLTTQVPKQAEILFESQVAAKNGVEVASFKSTPQAYLVLFENALYISEKESEVTYVPPGAILSVVRHDRTVDLTTRQFKQDPRPLVIEADLTTRSVQLTGNPQGFDLDPWLWTRQWRFKSRKDAETCCSLLELSREGNKNDALSCEETRKAPVLLRGKLTGRYEVLSEIEIQGKKRRSNRVMLQVRAAQCHADAIMNFQEERSFGFDHSAFCARGWAIRALDDVARVDLLSRRFFEDVGNLSLALVLIGVMALFMAGLQSTYLLDHSFTPLYAVHAATYLWPLLIAIVFRTLRWPQLITSMLITFAVAPLNTSALFATAYLGRVRLPAGDSWGIAYRIDAFALMAMWIGFVTALRLPGLCRQYRGELEPCAGPPDFIRMRVAKALTAFAIIFLVVKPLIAVAIFQSAR